MNPNEIELIQLLDKQIFPYLFPLFFFRNSGRYLVYQTVLPTVGA